MCLRRNQNPLTAILFVRSIAAIDVSVAQQLRADAFSVDGVATEFAAIRARLERICTAGDRRQNDEQNHVHYGDAHLHAYDKCMENRANISAGCARKTWLGPTVVICPNPVFYRMPLLRRRN